MKQSFDASPSELSNAINTNLVPLVPLGIKSQRGESAMTQLIIGFRVFSARMTIRICFEALSRLSLAFPTPLSLNSTTPSSALYLFLQSFAF
jgi:hypothetical protein